MTVVENETPAAPSTPDEWRDFNTVNVLHQIINNTVWRHEGESVRLNFVVDNLEKDQTEMFAELTKQSLTADGGVPDPVLLSVLDQMKALQDEIRQLREQGAPAEQPAPVQSGSETEVAPVVPVTPQVTTPQNLSGE